MRNPLVSILIGAIVAAGIAYAVWGRQVAQLQSTVSGLESKVTSAEATVVTTKANAAKSMASVKHRATTITLVKANPSDANDKTCKAKVEHDRVSGYQTHKVAWMIEQDPKDPCDPGLGWSVELDFDEVNGTRPFNQNPMSIGQDGKFLKIKNTGKTTTEIYPYKVLMNPLLGATYPMADPDLEVEPPPSPAPQVPPAPPPPAKKQ